MGNTLILTGTSITDLTAPKLVAVDPLECAGSLALYEPGHPINPFAGVPVNNSVFPNLLLGSAQAMIPTATAGDLAAVFYLGSEITGTKGKVERSAKGGLHQIRSQTVAATSTANKSVFSCNPTAIHDYLVANPTHDAFISQWGRITRPPLAGGNQTAAGMPATAGDWFKFFIRADVGSSTEYPTSAVRIGFRHSNNNPAALGPVHQNMAVHPAPAPSATEHRIRFWQMDSQSTDLLQPSAVFYRFYLEDLTVSGRSYAQVDALDYAEYTRQVLTPGGRYYGDAVPTDPATIP